MTKKDYIKFADMLRRMNPAIELHPSITVVDKDTLMLQHANMIRAIVAIFKEDNSNFKEDKFINYILRK